MTTADARRPALSAIPDLGFGAAYLAVWVLPGLVGAAVVSWLTLVIVLEAPALLAAYVLAMAIPPLTDGNAPGRTRAAALPPEHARWCAMPAGLVHEFCEADLAGDWCAEPHRALAGGALYFFASAFRTVRRARRRR